MKVDKKITRPPWYYKKSGNKKQVEYQAREEKLERLCIRVLLYSILTCVLVVAGIFRMSRWPQVPELIPIHQETQAVVLGTGVSYAVGFNASASSGYAVGFNASAGEGDYFCVTNVGSRLNQ